MKNCWIGLLNIKNRYGIWYKLSLAGICKFGFVGIVMRVKLEEVCVRGTSNIKQVDVTDKTGDYPIYGASGYIGN